jgi:hypothetical protein
MTGDNLSTPLWQCVFCGATGEAATAAEASMAALEHIRASHSEAGYLSPSPSAAGGRSQWELDLEAKHGKPLSEITGTVYALHYDPPRVVKSVSTDYAGITARSDADGLLSAGPVTHYVGWTQQTNPRKRIGRHAPMGVTNIVHLAPGTMTDEQELKTSGVCPKCGEPYRDSLAHGP